ncbi:monocarboxylate transporter 10-like [Anneissia japonica]|uniref:monocarboxylate transporter 10-like n=1 Tax=Anneissia japonica TaxID=1529436 RepID=UPI0014257E34|nr:monocarboxylate transporter 10-like [Anneissia japonica]
MNGEFQPPEGGWGWVVCLASTWTNGTVFGILNCFGVLLIQILNEIENVNLTTACNLFHMPIGQIAKREYRYIGFSRTASFSHYFKKKMGLVNGLVTTGSAIFTIVLPMVMRTIQDKYGLQKTLQFLGLLVSVLIPCACVYTPLNLNEQSTEISDSKRPRTRRKIDCTIWRVRDFLVWAIATPVSLFGYFVPFVHLINHTNLILPNANAEVLIALMGATSGVGRLIFGPVSDLSWVNPLRLQQIAFLVIGVISTLIPVCNKFYMLAIGVCIMGIFDGCFVSMMGPVAFNVVGKDRMSQALGYVLGLMSIPMMVGPPVAGAIFSYTGTYEFAFYYAGAPPIIGACILFLVRPSRDVVPGHLEEDPELDSSRFYDKKREIDEGSSSCSSSSYTNKHAYGNESFANDRIREDSTFLLVTDKVSVV